ncbi:MAG: hotdog fold thioesterase [Bacteroidales bacterium]|jgi:1,4-dihydroxy-2-naphthoyl-CoA hydrolase|nr:hotdog fold thioesterase [Bacteroidales bacterium]
MNFSLDQMNETSKGTMMEVLGIEYLIVEQGYIKAKMPVDERTRQPFGILHGGASVALAETIGSVGSAVLMADKNVDVRGVGISANHVKAVKSGWVFGEARTIHVGKKTHIWDIQIKDGKGDLVSTARLTNFILLK